MQDLGQACVGLVKAGGSCQAAPGDSAAQRDVLDSNKLVQDKVWAALLAWRELYHMWTVELVMLRNIGKDGWFMLLFLVSACLLLFIFSVCNNI